jgi:hypothetical protein
MNKEAPDFYIYRVWDEVEKKFVKGSNNKSIWKVEKWAKRIARSHGDYVLKVYEVREVS